MNRHVLVAMGRSDGSGEALEFALREYPEATVSVIHVTEPSDPLGLLGSNDPAAHAIPDCGYDLEEELLPEENSFDRAQRRRTEHVFERACELSARYDREIEPVVRAGGAAEEIVAYADERDVDHVVISEHEPTQMRRVVRGVAESVARKADPPVTIPG